MSLETQFIRPAPSATGSTDALPVDLTNVVLKRIVFLCLTPPTLVILGNIVNLVNSYVLGITSFDYSVLEAAHDIVIILVSLALAWTVHRRLLSSRALIKLGLAFCVFAALWFSATECLVVSAYHSDPIRLGLSYFSFSLVWVVFFPAIVPMRSTAAVVTIVLAASMSPLTRWLSVSNGWVEFSEGSITFITIAMLFSVVMGLAVSNVVYRLGRSVTEAREMGSYRLEENLGSGGMGEVWVASHRMLARPAAVKFIKHEVIRGMGEAEIQKLNQRFEHEVQATATLQSPHTVDIYDYGITPDGTFYYVMELLRGIDMETLVKRFGPIRPERAVYMLIQACHSLHEAHRRQLIHRDIKPANLFVCSYGEERDFIKLLDFGLVKHDRDGDDTDPKLTREGSITGTPAFMCPESITGKGPVDHRSDIYSIGCVAYWLLTGELVFSAETPMGMLTDHATAQPTPPSTLSEVEIPEALDEIVLACLAKHPDQRPQGADDLAARLEEIRFEKRWDNERARIWWDRHRVTTLETH
jgi:serine/threonine-protein kinase